MGGGLGVVVGHAGGILPREAGRLARIENADVAAVFSEMADLLQIKGTDRHRTFAFRRSSRIIESLPEPVEVMLRHHTFEKMPGVGPGTVHRVKQILRTGTCEDLVRLRSDLPPGLREMMKIKGVGATTVRRVYQQLGVSSIGELELAARSGTLLSVPRMGHGTVSNILHGIEAYKVRRGRSSLHVAERAGHGIVDQMRELPAALQVALAGSVRRRKATIGDLDILVATDAPAEVAARFCTLAEVREVLVHGEGRSSVRIESGQQVDLRALPPASFGAGLHYFTGSKGHNIAIRRRGLRMDVKISDKGIFTSPEETRIASGETEEEIFAAVGLPWIAPELRENVGEVEAAAQGTLPRLVEAADLRGDLHMHTTHSDGSGTIMDMVDRAAELGYDYIAITEHSQSLSIARGLNEDQIALQLGQIRELAPRAQERGVKLLAGVEVDILPDGELDLDLELLAQLDFVIASVHQWTNMGEAEMTTRVVRALNSGVVDCLGHPTGRRPGRRDPFALDFEAVLDAAKRMDVALECNGGPNRMDLPDTLCRRAKEAGVAVALNTDAHSARHLGRMEYALAMARRGWLEPRNVLNCAPWETIRARRRERLHRSGVQSTGPLPAAQGDLEARDSGFGDPEETHAWSEIEGEVLEAPARLGDEAVLDEEQAASLIERFAADGPLDDALRERLDAFLRGAADPTLEAALADGGSQPLQRAFDLLQRGSSAS